MEDDYQFMYRAEVLGKSAGIKGESPVGAVIVKDDEIVGEAEEAVKIKRDVTCHAEIEAIRKALKKIKISALAECTLYTTHEPCVMCSYAIRFYKIKKVVYLHTVDHLGGITSEMPLLTSENVSKQWGKVPEIVHLDTNKKD